MAEVLLVDDDRKLLSLLERGFRFEGFGVRVAGSGEDALRAARERAPDVVILDIGMTGIDGHQTCQRMRAESDVPILMLTARDEVEEKVRAFDLGADDYVTKPFAFDELLARTCALLRRRPSGAGDTKVVDVYVGYLRQKLGEPRLIHTVRGVGYALRA